MHMSVIKKDPFVEGVVQQSAAHGIYTRWHIPSSNLSWASDQPLLNGTAAKRLNKYCDVAEFERELSGLMHSAVALADEVHILKHGKYSDFAQRRADISMDQAYRLLNVAAGLGTFATIGLAVTALASENVSYVLAATTGALTALGYSFTPAIAWSVGRRARKNFPSQAEFYAATQMRGLQAQHAYARQLATLNSITNDVPLKVNERSKTHYDRTVRFLNDARAASTQPYF